MNFQYRHFREIQRETFQEIHWKVEIQFMDQGMPWGISNRCHTAALQFKKIKIKIFSSLSDWFISKAVMSREPRVCLVAVFLNRKHPEPARMIRICQGGRWWCWVEGGRTRAARGRTHLPPHQGYSSSVLISVSTRISRHQHQLLTPSTITVRQL